jgi:hypothetical protein
MPWRNWKRASLNDTTDHAAVEWHDVKKPAGMKIPTGFSDYKEKFFLI